MKEDATILPTIAMGVIVHPHRLRCISDQLAGWFRKKWRGWIIRMRIVCAGLINPVLTKTPITIHRQVASIIHVGGVKESSAVFSHFYFSIICTYPGLK
ncbi:MAG: hypothetical protein ACI9XK_001122 [Granulosicoccus sp.]|jgi:hypothetical protein